MADRARLPRTRTALGQDHFEGSSIRGWHRCVNLTASVPAVGAPCPLRDPVVRELEEDAFEDDGAD
ncbi:hypothetical protein [Streptomyces sp. NPDC046685]|uniref:hypothetical protein n=1 Tax=Streptomyces sp. NPDC046685 TaxID=3157202 RepID=UPI0033FF2CF8